MQNLLDILSNGSKKIAVLIDPDKTSSLEDIKELGGKINILKPSFIFVGGSTVGIEDFDTCIKNLKKVTQIPLVIFPGSYTQIHNQADGILFLSLISGRNPDYLIGHQVESAHQLKKMDIEILSTGYILIDGGKNSSVSYVSQTRPIPFDQENIAIKTAVAGETIGMKTIFMDAGSGAPTPINSSMIKAVKQNIDIPLIIGGGIKNIEEVELAFDAGADVVVIGNKIEEDTNFLLDLVNINTKMAKEG